MFRQESFRPLAASIALLLSAPFASAVTYFWDGGTTDIPTDGDGVSAGGAGTWDTALLNWDGGALPHVAWPNLSTDIASFGGAAAGTVAIGTAGQPGGTIHVGGLTFTTSGYVLGNVVNNGTLDFGATPAVLDASALTNGQVTLNTQLTGTAGLTINGTGATSSSGFTKLTGNNTGLTGGINITRGGITANGTSAFGNNQITITNGSTNGTTLFAAATSLVVNNNITIGTGGANFRAYTGGMLALNGIISESAAAMAITIVDSGVVRLNGLNTYTGITNLNAGILSFSNIGDTVNGGNLGKAGVLNFNGGTLRYTGASFTTTRSATQSNNGTFEIVNAATTVTINGTITGGRAGRTLNKTGLGTLFLGGSNDDSNGRYTVVAGTLVLGKASSGTAHVVGSGGGNDPGLVLTGGTARLDGTGGDQIYDNASVQITAGTFDMNSRSEAFDSLFGTGGVLTNSSATNSTLTLGKGATGNNGADGTLNNYSGIIRDGVGKVVLAKVGTGTQILSGANTYSGGTTISGGTLQIGNGGSLGSGAITNNATLTVSSGTGTILGPITGSGALNMTGSGTLTLNGTHTYAGATTVNAGTLNVAGSLASAITINTGATITGAGGTSSTITLNDGATILGGMAAVSGNGVVTSGNASALNVVVAGGALGSNVADVIKYGSGAAPDLASFSTAGYRPGAVVANDAVNHKVTLSYTAEAKTWNDSIVVWDAAFTPTWTGGDGTFYNGDTVTFGDIAADTNIVISGTVAPSAFTVSNSTNALTFSGSGPIAGAGGLIKTGAGTLVMSTANTYYGPSLISGGVLKLGNNLGLGATGIGNETVVASGATLDVDGGMTTDALATTEIIKIAGTGVNGSGALVNSNATVSQTNALTYVTLTDNASVGAAGTAVLGLHQNGGAAPILDLGSHTLTKVGTGIFAVQNGVITAGDIDVTAGTFRIDGGTYTTGAGTVTVEAGAILSFSGSNGGFSRSIVANSGTVGAAINNAGTNATIASDISLPGSPATGASAVVQFNGSTAGAISTVTGNISGTGSLAKEGASTYVFAGTNSYEGYTLLRGGTLRVGSATAIPATTRVVLYNASTPTFDLNGFAVSVAALNSGGSSDTSSIVQLGSGGGKLTVTGNGAAQTIGNVAGQFYGRFSGIGDIEYNNPTAPQGTWNWFNGASDFTGNIVITSGRLRFASSDGAIDSTALGNSENDLVFNGTPVNTLANSVGTASLQVTNGAVGMNTNFAGTRSIILNDGKEGTFEVWGSTFSNIRGVVTGGGILRKEDSGTLVLFNQGNNYTGETRIVNGTLQLGASGVIPDGSLVRLGSSAALTPQLDLHGNSETIAGLSSVQISDNTVKTNGLVTSATDATLTLNGTSTQNFGGVISGSVSLVKTGPGTQILSGANFYSGSTTINGGLLAVSGSLSGSAVTVNSGGALGGGTTALPGVVNGVTVHGGGTLTPGVGGLGTLTTTSLTLDAGAILAFDFSGASADLVNVNDTLSLGGNITLAISLVSQPTASSFTLFNVATGISGFEGGGRFVYNSDALEEGEIFTVIDNTSQLSQSFSISYQGGDGNDVVLNVVPEPGSAVLFIGGLACVLNARRRRRK